MEEQEKGKNKKLDVIRQGLGSGSKRDLRQGTGSRDRPDTVQTDRVHTERLPGGFYHLLFTICYYVLSIITFFY